MFVELLLFIKSQFTTNASQILHLNQYAHAHVWSRTVTPFHRFRSGWELFDSFKNALMKCLLKLNWSWKHNGFEVSHTWKPKRVVVNTLLEWTKKCFWFSFWCGEFTLEICPNILDTLIRGTWTFSSLFNLNMLVYWIRLLCDRAWEMYSGMHVRAFTLYCYSKFTVS